MSLRQMHKYNNVRLKTICLYLSEVGQHIRTSFTHLSEENNRRMKNTLENKKNWFFLNNEYNCGPTK